ncbi:J domain-containing protein [Pleomorphomonas carboxyditropha]|uniref:J domain-containing protein n=2 Tax=Pleomorphomonas TaxID=261933 RepID=A0A2G9WT20_9HYPH|nr:J domain-containing protein [Pleomorphomonas carboxyditropha]PIO97432.1 hypothetical protein CJ014_20620 [Pleomorphomonas carboxyditropha]
MDHSDPLGLYRVLGLTPSATMDEIRTAFRKRSKETHPDSTGRASADAFREVSDAYDILGDPIRRGEYDKAARELDEQQRAAAESAWKSSQGATQPPPRPAPFSPMFQAIVMGAVMLLGSVLLLLTLDGDAGLPAKMHRAHPDVADQPGVERLIASEIRPRMTIDAVLQPQRWLPLNFTASEIRQWWLAPPSPVCQHMPFGGLLDGEVASESEKHGAWFKNTSEHDVFVKIRDVSSAHVVASLFLKSDRHFYIDELPAGEYIYQYSVGDSLDIT